MKVLVISANSFSNVYNNGKTMKMMFSDFDRKEVCQLFIRGLNEIDANTACSYYHIPERALLKKLFVPWVKAGHEIDIFEPIKLAHQIEYSSNTGIKRNVTTQILRELLWITVNWDDANFWNWIQEQKPDIIYLQAGYPYFMHRMAWKIQDRLNIPMVSHFMDDYVVYPRQSLYRRFLKHIYRKTIGRSTACYAIGKDMAKEYGLFFDKPFKPIMNIVPWRDRDPKVANSTLKISYFGSLYYKRIDAIIEFAEFLKKDIDPLLKKDYIIQIFSSSEITEEQTERMKSLKVRNMGFVQGEDFKREMAATDIYLHVESDDDIYKRLTKLCVSTKIPEYLISYRPSIAYGPSDLASIKVFSEIDSRMVVAKSNGEEKNETVMNIASILNNEEVRAELSAKCYDYACNNFLVDKVASNFKKELENIVVKDSTY